MANCFRDDLLAIASHVNRCATHHSTDGFEIALKGRCVQLPLEWVPGKRRNSAFYRSGINAR